MVDCDDLGADRPTRPSETLPAAVASAPPSSRPPPEPPAPLPSRTLLSIRAAFEAREAYARARRSFEASAAQHGARDEAPRVLALVRDVLRRATRARARTVVRDDGVIFVEPPR